MHGTHREGTRALFRSFRHLLALAAAASLASLLIANTALAGFSTSAGCMNAFSAGADAFAEAVDQGSFADSSCRKVCANADQACKTAANKAVQCNKSVYGKIEAANKTACDDLPSSGERRTCRQGSSDDKKAFDAEYRGAAEPLAQLCSMLREDCEADCSESE